MLTSDDLAAQLKGLDLDDVAKRSGVVKKTLQRFIAKSNEPRLETANRVFAAIQAINKAGKRQRSSKQEA
jgi:DNA-binding LacI/PurR family transcriptional regulator